MYDILPFIGTDELKFGSNIESIVNILGEPKFRDSDDYGMLLYYQDLNVMFNKSGLLEEIGFIVDSAKVSFRGTVLEDGSRSLQPHIILKQFDPQPIETKGGALLYANIGISITGYHNSNNADQAISCFKKGLWDDLV